jgi:Fe-S-cluster-containing hydrogenase component 2/flavodoxin
MNTVIYYFSATGNSLAVARTIADKLEKTKLISIARLDPAEASVETADQVGFVFPVYAWGPPRIMTEFMERVFLKKDQYVFAVATCGGTPGGTMNQVKKIFHRKDIVLSSGFVLNTGSYPIQEEAGPISLMRFLGNFGPSYQAGSSPEERMNTIVQTVKKCCFYKPEVNAGIANLVGHSLHRVAIPVFGKSSRKMRVNGSCTECRICERICPRGNITVNDGRHVWGNNCEGCLACVQWCPTAAIDVGEETTGRTRGHNAAVKATDLMTQTV